MIIIELRVIVLKISPMTDILAEFYEKYDLDFEWCIVGNIVEKHYYGSNEEIRLGTKHFRPNTKILFP